MAGQRRTDENRGWSSNELTLHSGVPPVSLGNSEGLLAKTDQDHIFSSYIIYNGSS